MRRVHAGKLAIVSACFMAHAVAGCAHAPPVITHGLPFLVEDGETGPRLLAMAPMSMFIFTDVGTLRVRVFDAHTGEPLPDAGLTPRYYAPGYIPADSGFTILNLPGRYEMEVAAPGYAPWSGYGAFRLGRETRLDVHLQPLPARDTTANVMVLTGKVVAAKDRSPIAGVTIRAEGTPAFAISTANGAYRLTIPLDGRHDGERVSLRITRVGVHNQRRALVVHSRRVVGWDFAMILAEIN